MPMFYRVVVDVIDMGVQIVFVTNLMFPIASLPYGAFVLSLPARANRIEFGDLPGKVHFDEAPACGVIIIFLWECPDCMQVIGQDHNGVYAKWMGLLYPGEGKAKKIYLIGE